MTHLPLLIQEKIDWYRWRMTIQALVREYHEIYTFDEDVPYNMIDNFYYNWRPTKLNYIMNCDAIYNLKKGKLVGIKLPKNYEIFVVFFTKLIQNLHIQMLSSLSQPFPQLIQEKLNFYRWRVTMRDLVKEYHKKYHYREFMYRCSMGKAAYIPTIFDQIERGLIGSGRWYNWRNLRRIKKSSNAAKKIYSKSSDRHYYYTLPDLPKNY